jgi:hypothetical protein
MGTDGTVGLAAMIGTSANGVTTHDAPRVKAHPQAPAMARHARTAARATGAVASGRPRS